MLARKAGYYNYQNQSTRTIAVHYTGDAAYGTRAEERKFSQVLWKTFALIAIIGILLLAHVAISAAAANSGYNLMREKQQVQQFYRENEDLRLDIAKMESPDRIYSTATQKLGMVAPGQVLYGPSYAKSSVGKHAGK